MSTPKYPGINKIIKILEGIPDSQFDMSTGKRENCNTPVCIGGHAKWEMVTKHNRDSYIGLTTSLSELCEIPWIDAETICYRYMNISHDFNEHLLKDYKEITRQEAIKMLATYRDTGIVEWPRHEE